MSALRSCTQPSAAVAASAAGATLLCALMACGGSSSGTPPAPTAPSIPSSPTPPPAQSTCRTFSAPGSYTLDADVGAFGNSTICLTIATSGVSVDCAQHVVNGVVSIPTGASDVSILNCVVPAGFVNPTNVTNLTIANSTISNILLIRNGQHTMLRGNHVSVTARVGGIVFLSGGSGNQVLDNVLDGGYHGQDLTGQGNDAIGADDGIVLQNESGDTVQGNTIVNVFDAGIEGVGAVSGTVIGGNTITSAIFAGISSYWCTHWQGNTISSNTVSESVQAIQIAYLVGPLCGSGPPPAGLFANNIIADNVLRDPLGAGTTGMVVSLPSIASIVTDNLIRGNNLGRGAISLVPLSGFVNGGGNVCATTGNFAC